MHRALPLALVASLTLAVPAFARHRQTPVIVGVTSSGDSTLPRVSPGSSVLCVPEGDPGSRSIFGLKLVRPTEQLQLSSNADDTNPSCAANSRFVAWESSTPGPGTQIKLLKYGVTSQPAPDPTGTSANPAVNASGNRLLFESTGDLVAGQNAAGARQIFQQYRGAVSQLTHGPGTSRNPVVSARSKLIAFDSTSDATETTDTGVAQIWAGPPDVPHGFKPVTKGLAPSQAPAVSADGKVVVFESRANLRGDGTDTGAPQIFLYHVPTMTFAQLTDDIGGCTHASVWRFSSEYRVAYACNGIPYFTEVRHQQRYTLDIPMGADTNGVAAELGNWFLVVSTNANLLGTGTTAGHQLYIWNLFKRPPTPIPGTITWWPSAGLRPY